MVKAVRRFGTCEIDAEMSRVSSKRFAQEKVRATNSAPGQATEGPTMLALLSAAALSAPELRLLTYDSDPATGDRKFSVMNDPVMGGKSHSKFAVDAGVGTFEGTCAIVPFLHAPGFCKVSTEHPFLKPARYADASRYLSGALYIEARSSTASYKGFKVEMLAKNVTRPRPGGMHHSLPSFKADFTVPPGNGFSTIRVPFNSFSVDWSDFTGECSTKDPTGEQHVCCSTAHPEVCPKDYHLAKLTGFGIWAEGVEGAFAIELKSISAGP